MRVHWSDRAIADLSEIKAYISEDSESAALAWLEHLFSVVKHLEIFPDQGRRVPEVSDHPELRELLVRNYRVLYQRKAERVEIIMVIHGRRNLAGMQPKRWES